MWLMTTDGFYSVVEKGGGPQGKPLAVRARNKEDLVRLCKRMVIPPKDIIETTNTDYRFRIYVGREELAQELMHQVYEIDYGNFKDTVTRRRGRKTHDVFSKVWSVLLDLESPHKRGIYSRWRDPVRRSRHRKAGESRFRDERGRYAKQPDPEQYEFPDNLFEDDYDEGGADCVYCGSDEHDLATCPQFGLEQSGRTVDAMQAKVRGDIDKIRHAG